jgi:SAM-dependent methyltransferase
MGKNISEAVRKGYGAVARAGLGSDQDNIKGIAKAFGYSEEELASIPAGANMGLSCGNPVAMASLREGEVVVDLGSGGGLDVFLAAQKVGPSGMAIGIDMTGDMISLARRNAAEAGHENVKFYLAEIEAMPLRDDSVDCVISNCVLNLCPDKDAALREIFRILKPGGRLAISDIALKKDLPEAIRREVAAWTGCIAGALAIDDNYDKLRAAGFSEVEIIDSKSDLNAYRDGGHAACCGPDSEADMSGGAAGEEAANNGSSCCSGGGEGAGGREEENASSCCGSGEGPEKSDERAASEFHKTMDGLLDEFDVNEYAASVKIFAVKPA